MATNSQIVTLDDEPSTAAPQSEQQLATVKVTGSSHAQDYLSGRKAVVTFFEQEGDLGKDGVFAQLNGIAYNIPRGVPVELHVEVLDACLASAVNRNIETLQGGGQRERDVMRFAYQVHRYIDAPVAEEPAASTAKKSAK